MSLSTYKVFQTSFQKENPTSKTNFIFRVNPDDDYDFNFILTSNNEIYIKELDKNIALTKITSVIYDKDTKNHKFDVNLDYKIIEQENEINIIPERKY